MDYERMNNESHSQLDQIPSIQETSHGQAAEHKALGTARMRSSCSACTDSKVRCDKKKPSCDRCSRNGKLCQYVRSRRCGRRSKKSLSSLSYQSRPGRITDPNLASQTRAERGDGKETITMATSPENPSSVIEPVLSELQLTEILPFLDPAVLPFAPTSCSASGETLATGDPSHYHVDPRELSLDKRNSTFPSIDPPSYMPDTTSYASSTSADSPGSVQTSTTNALRANSSPHQTRTGYQETQQVFVTADRGPACDCIAQLLTTFTSGSGPPREIETNCNRPFDGPLSPPQTAFHHTMHVCNRVLACPCLSYDERVTSLLSMVILSRLMQDDDLENPDPEATLACFSGYKSVVGSLAARLQACQPGFARARSGIFAQFWFATSAAGLEH